MSDLGFDMQVQDKTTAEGNIRSSTGGAGRNSQYEPVAKKYADLPEGKAIVIEDLEQNDVQNLRNLLYRRFGKEQVIVRSRQQDDESYTAVVRDREGDEYLRDEDTNGEPQSSEDVNEDVDTDEEDELEEVF